MADDEKKPIRYDIDGSDVLTAALRELVNQYPGLALGDNITFSTLEEKRGKAMFPISGAVIESEKTTVTGRVIQVCLYPFCIVYRASGLSENNKAQVKEWLDNLGKWLERQEVVIGGEKYRLEEYPILTGQRKFLSISRTTPSYLDNTSGDNTEDWVIRLSARYQNEFYRQRRE